MGLAAPFGPRRRSACAALLAISALAACGSGGSGQADRQVRTSDTAKATETSASVSSGIDADDEMPSADSMTTSNAVPTSTPRTTPPFAEMPRSAAPKGRATSLLTGVKTGRQPGFERIVFDFAGNERPGYQVEWVDGPVAAAGSGRVVDVAGSRRLRIVFDPASGVDLATGDITYSGPNRLELPTDRSVVLDVVRTGDFEAVMTWVAGTDEVVPFRVLTLSEPTRVVVDVAVPPAR